MLNRLQETFNAGAWLLLLGNAAGLGAAAIHEFMLRPELTRIYRRFTDTLPTKVVHHGGMGSERSSADTYADSKLD